jgi:hypothetical protein
VATAAQTTISGVDANSLTLAYVAGSEAVYVNGALQVRGQDYTATNGTSVVMTAALAVNDVVEIFAYTAFTVANAYTKSETDSVAAAAAGMRLVVPSSISVGSGTGSASATGTVTFSSASSVSFNNVFSSTYQKYKIIFSITTTDSATVNLRWRVNGTDNSTASSYLNEYHFGSSSSSTAALETFSYGFIGYGRASAKTTGQAIVHDVYTTEVTHLQAQYLRPPTDLQIYNAGLYHNQTVSYDGFTLYPSSGTFSGTVSVYGYKV